MHVHSSDDNNCDNNKNINDDSNNNNDNALSSQSKARPLPIWHADYPFAAVEDPFDATDNCARTIGQERLPEIAREFGAAAEALLRLDRLEGGRNMLLGPLLSLPCSGAVFNGAPRGGGYKH
jgi:hypothetical protein